MTAHRGGGTRVALNQSNSSPTWNWASLVNQAERFLLESVGQGYTPAQVESALTVAISRWQTLSAAVDSSSLTPNINKQLRFAGSHDLALECLSRLVIEDVPEVSLTAVYVGSLGGLIALAQGEADIAGAHLWDSVGDSYNVPFIRRVLPGRSVVLLTLAYRSLGLLLPQGNPQNIQTLADLVRADVSLVNRQPGSGTRVWLDAQLKDLAIKPQMIAGYDHLEVTTHLAVAQAVADGKVTAGLAIQSAAAAYNLAFIPLTEERYDLVFPAEIWETEPAQALAAFVRSLRFQDTLTTLGGYRPADDEAEVWIT